MCLPDLNFMINSLIIIINKLNKWISVFCKILKSIPAKTGAIGNLQIKNSKISPSHSLTNSESQSNAATYQLWLPIKMMLISYSFREILKQKTSNTFRETSRWEIKKKLGSLGQRYSLKNKRKIIVHTQISLRLNSDK